MSKIFNPFSLRDHPGFNPVFLDWFRKIELILDNLTSNPLTEYTPIVTSFSGAFTTLGSLSGRYQRIKDNLWFIQIETQIITNGTAGGYIIISLPFTSVKNQIISGREYAVTGKMLIGQLQITNNNLISINYDNSYPGGDGHILNFSGIVEAEL